MASDKCKTGKGIDASCKPKITKPRETITTQRNMIKRCILRRVALDKIRWCGCISYYCFSPMGESVIGRYYKTLTKVMS